MASRTIVLEYCSSGDKVLRSTDAPAAILDAALDAFTENGYAATTIADVRARSGASVGSIYHHFADKEGIAAALYVECLRDYQRGLDELLAGESRRRAGIRGDGRPPPRVGRAPAAPRPVPVRGPRGSRVGRAAEIEALNRDLFAVVREWLRPHQAAGEIRRMPLELLYVIVLGPSQEYARHWLRGPDADGARSRAAEPVLARAAWDAVRA